MTQSEILKVTEWRVHIGAHKTATTHLQDRLAAARDDLAAQGLDFLPRKVFRPLMGKTLKRRRVAYQLGGFVMRRALAAGLESIRLGPSCIAISEEDLLGPCEHLLGPVLYPKGPTRIGHIQTLSNIAPLTLFLSIRSFDQVLGGAYATALKFRAAGPGVMSAARKAALTAPPSWIPLIERLMRAAPRASFRVWRQEDYARDAQGITEAFLGRSLPDLPEIPPPAGTITPSNQAIAEVEVLLSNTPADLPIRTWVDRANEVFRRLEAGSDGRQKFMPFSDEEQLALQKAYACDIDEIHHRWPDMLITPGPTPA